MLRFRIIAAMFLTTESGMNYNSVILAGVVALITIWWFAYGTRKYRGPRLSGSFTEGARASELQGREKL